MEHCTKGNAQYWGTAWREENPSWVQGREPVTIGVVVGWGNSLKVLKFIDHFVSTIYWILPSGKDYFINVILKIDEIISFFLKQQNLLEWDKGKMKKKMKKMLSFIITAEFRRESDGMWVTSLPVSRALLFLILFFKLKHSLCTMTSLVAQTVECLPTMQET